MSQQRIQIWTVGWWPLLFLICGQVACRHCWTKQAVCTEFHVSCWICHSLWQQSVAVFSKLRKQKL